jgi:hypothetical protein
MGVLKYKDSNGNYQPIVGLNVQNEVVQTTGQSTTAVMSQKASTDSFYTKSQVDNKVAIYYNPSTRGMVFPTDTSRVEYNPQTKGMIFH